MGKVIQTDSPSKRREKILRLLATMLQNSDFNQSNSEDIKNVMAFAYLSLIEIDKTVSETVNPWEKRDYWLKADKFRKAWGWVKEALNAINTKMTNQNWKGLAAEADILRQKLADVEPLIRMSATKFWDGAYRTYKNLHKQP
jgi:hypothetical protein